ncbi:MOSC domain-containing protein [Hymenobacter armeniacus]|uniref:MOSC domain-containing protein n=1 Tax=Hymenobacter armeniacus TaxID=2771358 RepID=A0ABR8JTL5_9BACT|nr:MOSC domain-containing protein [Hymenobacter armeniacus]MBD2721960.1 MOSC domain-containing protein [Hymenobacter armeniacus]
MRILSVNVGRPRTLEWIGRGITTAIFKEPVAGPVSLEGNNLAGDQQADLRVHGGPDKAVYAYASEHYTYWEAELQPGALVGPAAFGENLTTAGLLERDVRIGDEFKMGTAVLRAAQPRQPCYKLNLRFNDPEMVSRFVAAGRSGIYFQVLQPGVVQAGDAIELSRRSPYAVTIQDVTDMYYGVLQSPAAVQELLSIPYLPASVRRHFTAG